MVGTRCVLCECFFVFLLNCFLHFNYGVAHTNPHFGVSNLAFAAFRPSFPICFFFFREQQREDVVNNLMHSVFCPRSENCELLNFIDGHFPFDFRPILL